MKSRTTLLAAALVAASTIAACGTARAADGSYDAWCVTETSARGAVMCSSPELKALAITRNQLFNKARASISEDAYQALLADQRQWLTSSAARCGVVGDKSTLSYPIDPAITHCFIKASIARNAFLRQGLSDPDISATKPDDVASCPDHRPQLLRELHRAQRRLQRVENRLMAPPYYGGPAFAWRLIRFNHWKQNVEARIQSRIATINAEGQQEANCIQAQAAAHAQELLARAADQQALQEAAVQDDALKACETQLPCTDPGGNRIEKDASLLSQKDLAAMQGFSGYPLKDAFKIELEQIDAGVALAKQNGYKCDSVSSWTPYLLSKGFKISCNHFSYTYDFSDHGRGLEFSAE